MKTKIFFNFLLIFFMSLALVSASLNLNKGKLDPDIVIGEEFCDTISVSASDYSGTISVRDKWAETFDEERNLNSYTSTAEDHDMTIQYENNPEIVDGNADVEVCITPTKLGKYKGALIFTPESDSNVVVEVGTWLFVNVIEKPTEDTPQPNPNPSPAPSNNPSSGGGGGSPSSGGSSSSKTTKTTSSLSEKPDLPWAEIKDIDPNKKTLETEETLEESTSDQNNQQKPGLTGRVVDEEGNVNFKSIIWIALALIVIAAAILVRRVRRNK
jgi:hypothetical protein